MNVFNPYNLIVWKIMQTVVFFVHSYPSTNPLCRPVHRNVYLGSCTYCTIVQLVYMWDFRQIYYTVLFYRSKGLERWHGAELFSTTQAVTHLCDKSFSAVELIFTTISVVKSSMPPIKAPGLGFIHSELYSVLLVVQPMNTVHACTLVQVGIILLLCV